MTGTGSSATWLDTRRHRGRTRRRRRRLVQHQAGTTVAQPATPGTLDADAVTARWCAGRGPDRYDPGLSLVVTRWEVSSRVRDACANSATASVRSRLPSVVGELVTTRWDGPTVDDPRSAGTRVMSASRRSSRIPSRRTSTDARMTTGETPRSPRWLVAELLQLWAVLGQPGRRALRRRQILLIEAHALPRCRGRPETQCQQAGHSQVFVLRR